MKDMLLLKNATFIDWQTLQFKQSDIVVSSNKNSNIELVENFDINNTVQEVIDCTGKYVTKSFGCAHHQSYIAMATGIPGVSNVSGNIYDDLRNIWWKYDKTLSLEAIKLCAYATAIACAKNGVTMIIDHHSSPNAIAGSLQTIADAFNEVGVGHLLCYEISDRDGVNIAKQALIETENYLQNNEGLVGLHASFTLTNQTLEKAAKLAYKYNTGIHVNVAEDIYDQEHCFDIHNKRVIERFYDMGILDLSKTILAHCLYLTDQERDIIRNSGVYVVQNTESNLNNSTGNFNSCGIGNNIMLGTGGLHSNMLRAAKATFFNGQLNDTIDFEEIYKRFRNIHNYFSNNNFKQNSENNLVVFDYQPHTHFDQENFLSHFLYGFDASNIQHVIANGKLIMKNRVITTVNEQEIKEQSKAVSKNIWKQMHTYV